MDGWCSNRDSFVSKSMFLYSRLYFTERYLWCHEYHKKHRRWWCYTLGQFIWFEFQVSIHQRLDFRNSIWVFGFRYSNSVKHCNKYEHGAIRVSGETLKDMNVFECFPNHSSTVPVILVAPWLWILIFIDLTKLLRIFRSKCEEFYNYLENVLGPIAQSFQPRYSVNAVNRR